MDGHKAEATYLNYPFDSQGSWGSTENKYGWAQETEANMIIKGIVAYCYAYEVASDCTRSAAHKWHKVTRRCCGNIITAMKSLGDMV